MTRTLTRSRPRLIAALLASAALVLTGCQAGSTAETSQPYNPSDGRNVNIPEDAGFDDDYIAIRNAIVVSDGGAASLTASIINHGAAADVLTEARINGEVAVFAGGPFEVAPGAKLAIGGGGDAVALVNEGGVSPGQWTEISFTFAQAGTTTMDVLVISPDDEFAVLGEDV